MTIFDKIFGKKIKENQSFYNLELSQDEIKFIDKLNNLPPDNRLGNIMSLGDSGDPKYLNILLHSILTDKDIDVRFAGLKRLSNFSEKEKIKSFLINLKHSKNSKSLEPYLSMALLNFQIITEDEFEKIINGS